MVRGGEDDAPKPSDLTEAQREALKRQYRGVFWDRKTKRWRCQLGYQSKKIFLGYFDDAGEAARAYDQKLVELRGAGARTNFPITEYLDMMPTPTKRGGAGAAAVAAAAAAAAARDNDQAMDEVEVDGDGEEIDQPASTAAAAGGYGTDTPSLDPGYGSATAGGHLPGLKLEPVGSRGYARGSSTSPRQGLSHLPAIAPLSTDLPCSDPHAAALAAQDFDVAGEDELTAAAQLAIEMRRSFDGSNFKWQQQQQQQQQQFGGGHHPASSGSAGGSAGAAAAAGYDVHQRSQQQQQQMGAYRNDTAAAAAAGYGGNASLYGTFGHHHHAGPNHYHQQQQQQGSFAGQHVRNGSSAGELYGGSQGWADPAAAAATGGPYEGHLASYGSSHYPHSSGHQQQQQHHSHPGVAAAHGGFRDSAGLPGQVHGEGYPMHHHQQQQQQHTSHHAAVAAAAAAAAAAAGYGHHSHHAAYEQQHGRHYQQQMYHQHHQRPPYHQANGDDQQMAAAGHLQQQQQQQHYMGAHAHQQQQQHGHYPLHHSHSYPGATNHENGMEGAAAAGYYGAAGTTRGYVSHAEAVAAHRASQQGQFAALHAQQHHQQHAGEGMVSAQGMYGSSGELQQHYGGGLQQQQQYDARAAASNPAVAAADYRQRLATYGLHSYASEPVEYRGAGGVEGEGHPEYPGSHLQQQYQQHMQQDNGDLAGTTPMDATGPGNGTNEHYNERYNERGYTTHAAYDTEDPWVQSRGGAFGRGSAAGSDGGLTDGAAGAGLPAVRTTRASGRSSRGAGRALAATAESDEYDVDDDEDYGSDSDTGRGRGRNSRRRSRTATAAAAAVGINSGEGVLRTKQRDGGDDERGHSYRGVFWDKKSRRWRCQLGHKNKKIFLGYFGVAEDAARAYDQKLVELHGVSAKTNFPIQNYLGGGGSEPGSARDTSGAAAGAAESPRAPGGPSDRADVPTRRRSSYAGDGSAKASHGQHSELSWGALGFGRSSRLSHDASEGAPRSTPRLSWAGLDTLSSWDQQDPDSQYAKRRRLLEGSAQLPTSPQDFGSLAGAMDASHQAVGGDDMLPGSLGRQGSGYRVVETPSVLTNLTGRHSSSGQQGGSGVPSIDAGAMTVGIFTGQQVLSPMGGRSSLALSRLASGEMGAVQALSGLHALSSRSNTSAPPGFAAAAAAASEQQTRLPCGSSAVDAVLAAAGAHSGAAAAAALAAGCGAQQQQQSHASRLFDEAVHQYGGKVGAPDRGPSGVSTVTGRVSDPNTGTSSSTATPPSAITAGGQFGASRSPLGANAQAALSRLNSSEVQAVQALSGIHNDLAPFQSRHGVAGLLGSGDGSWGGFGHRQSPQGNQHVQQQSPVSITENVAKDLICRAPVVSAIASSSIATVAAAAAVAAAAKGVVGSDTPAAGRNSADGSFSGILGEIAAGLGEGRAQAGTPPDVLNPEQLPAGFSPLLVASSTLLLPPPPPLQFDVQEHGVAAAAAGFAAGGNAASGRVGSAAGLAAQQGQMDVAPGDAFAAEAGWGNPGVEDLLMPKKRPSCSGSSGLIGLLGDIGQFKTEADAAAAAVVVQRDEPAVVAAAAAASAGPAAEPGAGAAAEAAAGVGAAAASLQASAEQQQPNPKPEAPATAALAPAGAAIKAAEQAPVAPSSSAAAAAAELQSAVLPATAAAALAPVAYMAEPMAVLP